MSSSISRQNNPVLQKIVKGYTPVGFIREEILPKIIVKARKGDILSADSKFLRIHNNVTVKRSTTPEITFSTSIVNGWNVEDKGLKMIVTAEDGANWDPTNASAGMLSAKATMSKLVRQSEMLGNEFSLATVIQDAANYAAGNKVTLSGTDQYNDYANSDPIGDFQIANRAIRAATGLLPNKAVMSWEVWDVLRFHPSILALVGTNKDKLTGVSVDQLAMVMGVDSISIGKVFYNSAKGGQTKIMTPIWGKKIMFMYVNPNPSPEVFEDSFGNTFTFDNLSVDSWKVDDPKDAEFVRVTESYDDVIRDFNAGYLITDAIA